MTDIPSHTVQGIIEDALGAPSPVAVLDRAIRDTAKGGRTDKRRKLTQEEAFAAVRVVTKHVTRNGLKATVVLQKDGRASGPEQTYPFFLTEEEMAVGTVRPGRRLAKGIAAHVDGLKAIARTAREQGIDVDEGAMLAELADAIPDFLDQFRAMSEPEPDAELAEDVARIAAWLASPARRFELVRVLNGADQLDLDYDPKAGLMDHVGRDVSPYADGVMPWVPLRLRDVGEAEATVFVRDPVELEEEAAARARGGFAFYASPKLVEVGRETLIACQRIGLGVMLERGRGLRMTFTVDHRFYAGTSFREDTDGSGARLPKHLMCRGIPQAGSPEIATDGIHYVGLAGPLQVRCPEFLSYLRRIEADDVPGSPWEAVYARRHMPVTEETCRLLLDGGDRDAMFPWRWFADVVEETVLESSVISDDGTESWLYRDRFAELLYRPGETGLAGLLEAEAVRREAAYGEFLMRTAGDARRRKLDFRRRMRG